MSASRLKGAIPGSKPRDASGITPNNGPKNAPKNAPKNIEELFRKEKVGCFCRAATAVAFPETPLSEVLDLLRGNSGGCVVIVRRTEGEPGGGSLRPVGILTERDYLDKLSGKLSPSVLHAATAASYMTTDPRTISYDESLDTAIQLMTRGGYRHLPLVDRSGNLAGVLSARDIITYLAQFFPVDVMNLPPRAHQRIGSREGE